MRIANFGRTLTVMENKLKKNQIYARIEIVGVTFQIGFR